MADTVFKLNAAGRVAIVTIDNGEDYRKPTTLGRSAFESAVQVIEELERGDWEAAVFTGKPFVFCVGADIDEFGKVEDPREGIRAGHELFGRIRALPFPTVAAINGAALGGGLELALHCTARTLAANVRHIGFPEVFLSIIPGWGGTQLLPKLIGPEAAAKVIVLNPLRQNKLLKAQEALELGIVDTLLDPVEFLDESLAFARTLSVERTEPDWSDVETVLRKARSRVDDAVHGATRAPYAALDLIAGAQHWSIEEGYTAEEDAMAELLVSNQAQASAYAFTVVERRSKKPPALPDAKPRRVQKVGIVGAGLMATQIATLFVKRLEVPVVMRDLEQSRVDDALKTIREDVAERKPFLATLVDGGTGWEQFAGCDIVLEAVFEELEVKREVFAAVREVAPDAILMTNTSSLSVEEMGADVGMHFFNPVAMMPLVEIVRHADTTDEVLATAWDVVKKLRKRGVIVADSPGFVVNRVLTRVSRTLMDALENGNTSDEVDEAMLGLGMPMAPSVLIQMVGPRVALHVLETMHAAFPDRFPLSPALDAIANGEEPAAASDNRRTVDEIRTAVLEAAADEIRHMLDEGVVGDPADVDACLILGAGYPFFLGGITKHLDQTGVSERVLGSSLAAYGKIPA
ncbi:MAG TPA: 3-hydroxyacyl-CoA dehydrogenase NAD-binding domain-containing protein [Gaiellaceae bacterium]|nr:3-hydroxyacyl-CoA dehydrogenase NAD-binding domain-containing protein [Gaiellaceae bacterium]